MTQEEREQAARVLDILADRLQYFASTDAMNALDTAICVLREPKPDPIHLSPPLTDEQREQLKAIWALGGRWLAKDGSGNVFAYDSKPQKIMICSEWHNDKDDECFTVMRELIVCATVSWSDPEPFDIGKALGVGE